MEVKRYFILILLTIMMIVMVTNVSGLSPEDMELCKNYESMVRYETNTIVNKIEDTKNQFNTDIANRVMQYENRLTQIIFSTGKTILTYIVVGIFSIVFLSGSIFSLIMLKGWKKILMALSDEVRQLNERIRKMERSKEDETRQ